MGFTARLAEPQTRGTISLRNVGLPLAHALFIKYFKFSKPALAAMKYLGKASLSLGYVAAMKRSNYVGDFFSCERCLVA